MVAAFDVSPKIVGQRVEDLQVHHLDQLFEISKTLDIHLAILAVPSSAASEVVEIGRGRHSGNFNLCPGDTDFPKIGQCGRS